MPKAMQIEPEKTAQDVIFATAKLRAGGSAIILRFARSRNAPALAYLALDMAEAKQHAADIIRLVLDLEREAGQTDPP